MSPSLGVRHLERVHAKHHVGILVGVPSDHVDANGACGGAPVLAVASDNLVGRHARERNGQPRSGFLTRGFGINCAVKESRRLAADEPNVAAVALSSYFLVYGRKISPLDNLVHWRVEKHGGHHHCARTLAL